MRRGGRFCVWSRRAVAHGALLVTQIDPGVQTFPDGSTAQLPPVLFIKFIENADLRTVLVYGHYDVQPAALADGASPSLCQRAWVS